MLTSQIGNRDAQGCTYHVGWAMTILLRNATCTFLASHVMKWTLTRQAGKWELCYMGGVDSNELCNRTIVGEEICSKSGVFEQSCKRSRHFTRHYVSTVSTLPRQFYFGQLHRHFLISHCFLPSHCSTLPACLSLLPSSFGSPLVEDLR